jgi:hypothetical protein
MFRGNLGDVEERCDNGLCRLTGEGSPAIVKKSYGVTMICMY